MQNQHHFLVHFLNRVEATSFTRLEIRERDSVRAHSFHSFCSLPNIVVFVIFCAKTQYRCLYYSNPFSFVQGYHCVVNLKLKQVKCVFSVSVCVFLPLLLSRHWLQGTQGNRLSPVNNRGSYHGGVTRDSGSVRASFIL